MKYPFLMIAAFFIIACGSKEPSPVTPETSKPDTPNTDAPYFPLRDFIKNEIAYVDSLPVGIKKYIIRGSKKDSVYITPEEFHRLAAEFLPKEIDDSIFKKEFQETSFFDKSSNSATFFYATKNDSLPLKRVDVLSVKGETYDQVKSIFFQKSYRSGDTGFIKKLYWKPQRSFQIITQSSKDSGDPSTEIINVVWDNRE